MVDMLLQITLVVLLLLTVAWCAVVHHRLRRLRVERGEMTEFIRSLGDATARAEDVVRQMQDANRALEASTDARLRRTRQLGEELARLTDNAARVIKRLDTAVEQGATRVAALRTTSTVGPAASPGRSVPARMAVPQRSAPTCPVPAPADADGVAQPARTARPRRERQLDGLLHDELLDALQGLR